jgi:hypothetical protein
MLEPAGRAFSPDAVLRWGSCAIVVLGLVVFWGGLVIAAGCYPAEYNWRYMTLTGLLSSEHNPAGHLWASGGIALCGLCGLCWTQLLGRQRRREGAGRAGIRLLQAGALFMAGAVVLPAQPFGIRKGHEILVTLAFACWCLGMVGLLFRAAEQALRRRAWGSIHNQRRCAALVGGLAAVPVLLAGAAQAYVYYALPTLHWVSLSWRAQGIPVYLSFAFWEWVTCAVLSACAVIVALATSAAPVMERQPAPNWAASDPRNG